MVHSMSRGESHWMFGQYLFAYGRNIAFLKSNNLDNITGNVGLICLLIYGGKIIFSKSDNLGNIIGNIITN